MIQSAASAALLALLRKPDNAAFIKIISRLNIHHAKLKSGLPSIELFIASARHIDESVKT